MLFNQQKIIHIRVVRPKGCVPNQHNLDKNSLKTDQVSKLTALDSLVVLL